MTSSVFLLKPDPCSWSRIPYLISMVAGDREEGGDGAVVLVLVANSLMIMPSSLRLTMLTEVVGCLAAWLGEDQVVG